MLYADNTLFALVKARALQLPFENCRFLDTIGCSNRCIRTPSPINFSRKINSPICGLSPSGSSPSYRPACGLVSNRLPFPLPTTLPRQSNLIRWISHAHRHALRLGQRRKTSLPQHGNGSNHRVSDLQFSPARFATSADFRLE